jgi:hypothetical protein
MIEMPLFEEAFFFITINVVLHPQPAHPVLCLIKNKSK